MTSIVNFTPYASLAGGALIGLSAVGLMASLGRIMGLSGIVSGVIPEQAGEPPGWRIAFLVGAIVAPALLLFAGFGSLISFSVPVPLWSLPLSGVLVGIGVAYGNGCPSGHGICGIARFSPRSLVAVAIFMATAAITVFVTRHLIGA
jgi:uncharacterized protein